MNVFILDANIETSAQCLVDDHVAFVHTGKAVIRSCKMAIEAAQLMSTAHWCDVPSTEWPAILAADPSTWPAPYKPTHVNHPWAKACRNRAGYDFVWLHAMAILTEHTHRTGKEMESVRAVVEGLVDPPKGIYQASRFAIPVCRAGLEPVYVQTVNEAVALYRAAYLEKIAKMPHYTRREVPSWAR